MRRTLTLAILLAAVPGGLSAQLAPDTPRLMSPNGPGGLAVLWVQPDALPGDKKAIVATWTPPGSPGLRLRGGIGIGAEDDEAFLAAIDLQTSIARRGTFPFDLDWQAGAGVGFGNHLLLTVPVGVTAGTSWSSGSVWMGPYVSVGLAADLHLGDDFEGDEFDVGPALDIGLDLALDDARHAVIRAAASLGDRQTLAVGLAIGGGSRTR
jgi:hypothetical protein